MVADQQLVSQRLSMVVDWSASKFLKAFKKGTRINKIAACASTVLWYVDSHRGFQYADIYLRVFEQDKSNPTTRKLQMQMEPLVDVPTSNFMNFDVMMCHVYPTF